MPAFDRKYLMLAASIDMLEFSCIELSPSCLFLEKIANERGYYDSTKSTFCLFLFGANSCESEFDVSVSHVKKWL